MQEIVRYILSFLLYGNEEAAAMVGYTDDPALWDNYSLIILPNGHLGDKWVYPQLSAPHRDGKFISLDIVYNTAFFISRAEELLNNKRDRHGRFLAKYSILGQNNNLLIPLIDEYSRFLIKALQHVCDEAEVPCTIKLPEQGFSHVWLTHDVDTLERYRHLRGAIGGIMRGQLKDVLQAWTNIYDDPAFTFPWIIKADQEIKNKFRSSNEEQTQCDSVYFFKFTGGRGHDYPQYRLHGRDCTTLIRMLSQSGALHGWHSSYYGIDGHKAKEVKRETVINYRLHRSHFLRCSIDDMQRLVDVGVTDDFSMGFPDMAGFRLQTTRPVRWINPQTMQLTHLTLHPLTAMDCTLSDYMSLNEDEAFYLCQQLIEKIRKHHGEIVLLWHNHIFAEPGYHKSLYHSLLDLI